MLADARKQRLAELRGKSKPLSSVAASSSKSQALKSTHNKQNEAAVQTASSTSKLMPTNAREAIPVNWSTTVQLQSLTK
jgi:hypothetical protein